MKRIGILAAALAGVVVSGCQFAVSREAYQRDLAAMKGQQDQLETQKQALAGKLGTCEGDLAGCKDKLQAAVRDQNLCTDDLKNTKALLDQCANRGGNCAKDLINCQMAKTKADDDLRKAAADRDRLQRESKALADSLARIQEGVKKVQNRLKDLVAAGKLRIRERHGLLVIEVASDILFDLNKSEVKAAAKPVLAEIADALKSLADRRFQVAGHTDNTGPDAINWKLSVDRALAVLAEMTAVGVAPNNLSAAGFGPYLPVVANDSDANRARNRRVEFLLIPDLGELFRLGL